jgi:hypothetical protein
LDRHVRAAQNAHLGGRLLGRLPVPTLAGQPAAVHVDVELTQPLRDHLRADFLLTVLPRDLARVLALDGEVRVFCGVLRLRDRDPLALLGRSLLDVLFVVGA